MAVTGPPIYEQEWGLPWRAPRVTGLSIASPSCISFFGCCNSDHRLLCLKNRNLVS